MSIHSPKRDQIPEQPFHEFVVDAYKKERNDIVFNGVPDGISIKMPIPGIVEIDSQKTQSRKRLVIQCGVHGDERQGIIICNRIIQNIKRKQIRINCPVTIIYANPEAIALNQRTMPDGTNMNRIAHDNTYPCVQNIQAVYEKGDTLFDLHASFNNPNFPFSITYLSKEESHKRDAIDKQIEKTRGLAITVVRRTINADIEETTFPGMARQKIGMTSAHTIEIGSVGKEIEQELFIQICTRGLIRKIERKSPPSKTNHFTEYRVIGDILTQDLPKYDPDPQNPFDSIEDFGIIPSLMVECIQGETRKILDRHMHAHVLFAKRQQGGRRSGVLAEPVDRFT